MTNTESAGPRWARKVPTVSANTVHVVAVRDGSATALCSPKMHVSAGTQYTTAQVDSIAYLTKCTRCVDRGY